jgi:hypothetical protein
VTGANGLSELAAAEFDNFTAAQIRGQVRPSVLWMW